MVKMEFNLKILFINGQNFYYPEHKSNISSLFLFKYFKSLIFDK